MARALGGIEVEVREGEGAWRPAGAFDEAGPIAGDLRVLPFEAGGSGEIGVRLRLARGHFRLDAVALARLGEEVAPAAPSLFNATVRLVYSVDWKSEPFTTAWVAAAAPPGEGGPARPPLTASSLRAALDLFKKSQPGAEAVGFRLAGRRLYLELPPSPARGLRAQDIVQAVFGLEEPVFLVRRDEVVMAAPAV